MKNTLERTMIRIIAWEKDNSGSETVFDIIEFSNPFTPKGAFKRSWNRHVARLLQDQYVSRIQIERREPPL